MQAGGPDDHRDGALPLDEGWDFCRFCPCHMQAWPAHLLEPARRGITELRGGVVVSSSADKSVDSG